MAYVKSKWVGGNIAMPAPNGSEVVNVFLSCPVTAALTAADSIYVMGELPEDCVMVDAIFASADLDTKATPEMVMSFGVVNDDNDDLAAALQSSVTVAQTGTASRMSTISMLSVKSTASARKKLGYKVITAAGTPAAGTVYLSLSYRSVGPGD